MVLSVAFAYPAAEPAKITYEPGGTVVVIPVHEEIEDGLYWILNRGITLAENQRARAIVLDMHTPGGRVDSAMKIRDRLVQVKIPTYTYVDNMAISAGAFIAISTDRIVMARGSNIGGALPITLGTGKAEAADEKFISIFASEMRKTAKNKNHPEKIAEAFCNPDIEIPGVKEKGKILTLDYDDAVSTGIALYVAGSLDEMLRREGLGTAQVERFVLTPTDQIARFLATPVVMGILMLIGMSGLYIEVKAPGISLPGVLGVTALGLYFFGSYLANLSGYMEIISFIAGITLLLLEIFVVPGFGFVGVAGIFLIFGSLFFALFNLSPPGYDFRWTSLETPLLTMVMTLLSGTIVIWILSRFLPKTPLYGKLVLAPPAKTQAAPMGASSVEPLAVGQTGVAVSTLRPSGIANVAGRRIDVATEGDFVEPGGRIVITRIEGNHIFVRAAAES